MPFIIAEVSDNLLSRIEMLNCWLCYKPMNVKIGDYVVRKTTRKSRYAHIECGVKKNWIEHKDVEKLYLVPKPRKTQIGE